MRIARAFGFPTLRGFDKERSPSLPWGDPTPEFPAAFSRAPPCSRRIMAVPKKKKSPARRDMRRANHDRRNPPNLSACPNCGDLMLSHRVCPSCGHYKGRQVVEVAQD